MLETRKFVMAVLRWKQGSLCDKRLSEESCRNNLYIKDEKRDRVTSLNESLGAAILDFESVSLCILTFFFVPKGKNQQITS